jgi:hypothetical protein
MLTAFDIVSLMKIINIEYIETENPWLPLHMQIILSDYEDDEFNANFILTYTKMGLWRQSH